MHHSPFTIKKGGRGHSQLTHSPFKYSQLTHSQFTIKKGGRGHSQLTIHNSQLTNSQLNNLK